MKNTILELYYHYKIIIFPVLIGLAGLGLIFLVIWPQFNEYTAGQEELTAAKDRAALLDQKVKGLQSLNIQNIDDKLAVAVTAFPSDKDYPGVIGLIQYLVLESSLTLGQLQIGQGSSPIKGTSPSYSIRFEVSGSREALNSMLNKIEHSYRVVKVSTIDVVSNSSNEVAATINIESFYEPAPNALGSVDAPLQALTSDDEKIISELAKVAPPQAPQTADVSNLPRGKSNPFQ